MTITRVVTVWCDTDQCEAKASLGDDYVKRPAGWRRMGDRDFCPECSAALMRAIRPERPIADPRRAAAHTSAQASMLAQCRERPTWVRARNGAQLRALAELFEFGGLLERREYKTKTGAPRFEYKAKP